MARDHLPPGLSAEDAPGQIVSFEGVEYVADESGHSPELRLARAESKKRSDAIAAEMLESCLAKSPYGNPYSK